MSLLVLISLQFIMKFVTLDVLCGQSAYFVRDVNGTTCL